MILYTSRWEIRRKAKRQEAKRQRHLWELSSAGRASALQAEGHRFEPCSSHQYGPVVQLVRTLACHARGRRFEPVPGRHFCLCSSVGRAGDWKSPCRWFDSVRRHQKNADVAHLVERHLAKVEVAGSSPVIRSTKNRRLRCLFFLFCSLSTVGVNPKKQNKRKALCQ